MCKHILAYFRSSSSYGTQQDTRYQTYGQDYTQQYGAPAVDYNTAPQADYSQHGQQAYDERAYAGYGKFHFHMFQLNEVHCHTNLQLKLRINSEKSYLV